MFSNKGNRAIIEMLKGILLNQRGLAEMIDWNSRAVDPVTEPAERKRLLHYIEGTKELIEKMYNFHKEK